jgi:hypothetical protein
MLRDVNRNPRRWADESGRVRVIEGWHPSEPSQVGYNLILDDDWIGTFATLDDAATAATAGTDATDADGRVVLRPYPHRRARGGKVTGVGLHLVRPTSDEG